VLTAEIDKRLPSDVPSSAESREKLAKRQANAAVALLKINEPEKVWPLLKRTPPDDPRLRSYLIHLLSPLGADATAVIQRLDQEPDITIRRALILSLGEFGEDRLPAEEREALNEKLHAIYRDDPDPGLHAATEWLLRRWKQEPWLAQINGEWTKDTQKREQRLLSIEQSARNDKEKAPPRWYVNSQGQTMVVIPGPAEFIMGSPPIEEGRTSYESQHKERIGHNFALAAKPVTVEQYRKFRSGYGVGEIEQQARTGDSPVIGTSWFQAAAYCNWLNKQEGLPESEWCYQPLVDPKAMPVLAGSSVGLLAGSLAPLAATCGVFPARTDPEYKAGMKLARNYLQRTGYRLPMEAEMEYATRAGALTARYYGETRELLLKYAWYIDNSQERTWPVGSKKPNDFGLFDVYGNAYTWCQESYGPYQQDQVVTDDKEDDLVVGSTILRGLRGGSFNHQATLLRSAYRNGNQPSLRNLSMGFRPARTLMP
jgi:formylglycine-generating enzyme required for sulfatase activity